MDTLDIIGLGALNMDLLYSVKRVVLDGETIVDNFSSYPGGSAANTIYGLARLGLKTGFVGAAGDDLYGQRLDDDFRNIGVDTGRIKFRVNAHTGQALCLTDKRIRSLYILPGANALLEWRDIDVAYFDQSRLVHFSSFVDEAQLAVQRRLAGRLAPSVQLSFSPGSLYTTKGAESLAPILRRTSKLFLNESELRQLTGGGLRHGAQACLNHGCRTVVVTSGQGIPPDEVGHLLQSPLTEDIRLAAYIADGRDEIVVKARRIPERDIQDTTGAGDAFAAGFLFGFLREKGLEECGLLGDTVAQLCIRKVGARAGLPALHELSDKYCEWHGRVV